MRDWCRDLRDYPIEAIERGCQRWREVAQKDSFPRLSELRPLIEQAVVKPKAVQIHREWRHLSDEEYEALSLRDKIDHRKILANECRKAAGPQWVNGVKGHAVAAEDMPEAWHAWRAKAAAHDREAARLQGKIKLGAA